MNARQRRADAVHRRHGSARRRSDPARGIGGLLALAAIAGAVLLALGGPAAFGGARPAAAPPAATSVVEAGRGLYVANCAACHGPQGEGTRDGPSLVGAGAAAADFYLRTGRMPLAAPGQRAVRQPPRFDEAGIDALVAYVDSLGPGPSIPQVAGGGDVGRGWALFQANCAACHAATGSGNAIGGGFVAVGLGQADPRTIGEATRIGPGAMPAFGFEDGQLADLAAYIRWLRDAPTPGGAPIGGTGPVAEGFLSVAVGLPALLLAAVYVARRRRGTPAGADGGADGGTGAAADDAADEATA